MLYSKKTEPRMTTTTEICVAVFWPGEGYGIPSSAASMEDARAKAEEWHRLGCANSAKYKPEIHIIETTRTVTKVNALASA